MSITSFTNGDAKWFFDNVAVTAGETYTLTSQYKSTVGTQLLVRYTTNTGAVQYALVQSVPTSATWATLSNDLTIPANVVSMTVFHVLAAVGTLEVDDFELLSETGTPTPDTTDPTATVTSPLDGATVSGNATVNASAGDNVGVVGVTLLVDGTAVGAEDTTSPYSFTLDTTTLSNGAHTITVRARDAAGNTGTSAPVSITVDNTTPPPGGTNLILNGDFETENGADPLGWRRSAWGNHATTFTYPITGFDGNKGARIDITSYPFPDGSGDSKWVFDTIPVTPGVEYTYTDHYRANTISDIIGQYSMSDGTFHYFGLAKEIQPTSTWQTVTGTFVPPANATHITLFHLISAVGFLEIDDAVLVESGTGTPAETNAPVVEFTNPLDGQTVSGNVTLTASSTDDTAVTYIFYAVNGTPITGQLATAPYTHVWDTTGLADGEYVLKATTHDPYGNNSTATITVTVDNTTPPPGGTNLILNPSLETAGTPGNPANWNRGGWGTNNAVHTYPVAGIDGADAARVSITSFTNGDAKWFFDNVAVTAGETYTLTSQYKSTVGTQLLVRYTTNTGAVQYALVQSVPTSATWATLSNDLTIPANVVSMTVFHVLAAVGTLEVDDYSLMLVP